MKIIKKMMKWKATYWPPVDVDEHGDPILGDPVEIKCRWEDCNELYLNPDGEQKVSSAKVYVDRDLELGGRLFNGELDEAPADPREDPRPKEISKFDKLPVFKKNGKYLRTAWV